MERAAVLMRMATLRRPPGFIAVMSAVALGSFAWSACGSTGGTEVRQAEAHPAGIDEGQDELQCDPGEYITNTAIDSEVLPGGGAPDPRSAVASRLVPRGDLRAGLGEFVAGRRTDDAAEERLVRQGRLLAVVFAKRLDNGGWIVTGVTACRSVVGKPEAPS